VSPFFPGTRSTFSFFYWKRRFFSTVRMRTFFPPSKDTSSPSSPSWRSGKLFVFFSPLKAVSLVLFFLFSFDQPMDFPCKNRLPPPPLQARLSSLRVFSLIEEITLFSSLRRRLFFFFFLSGWCRGGFFFSPLPTRGSALLQLQDAVFFFEGYRLPLFFFSLCCTRASPFLRRLFLF